MVRSCNKDRLKFLTMNVAPLPGEHHGLSVPDESLSPILRQAESPDGLILLKQSFRFTKVTSLRSTGQVRYSGVPGRVSQLRYADGFHVSG